MKRIAFYCQDSVDPNDTADHQWERLQAATQGEDVQIVREYVDHRNLSLYRMLGEATQEEPPFDELLVPDAALLGDTEDEVKKRLAELAEIGVRVRVADGSPKACDVNRGEAGTGSHTGRGSDRDQRQGQGNTVRGSIRKWGTNRPIYRGRELFAGTQIVSGRGRRRRPGAAGRPVAGQGHDPVPVRSRRPQDQDGPVQE